MMNSMEFAKYAKEHIKEYLPEEYQQSKVRMSINRKINDTYMALSVDRGEGQPTPAVSIPQMYERYEAGVDLDVVMRDMAGIVQMEMPQVIDTKQMMDYEQAKENLFIRLADKEANKELMADGPYEEIDGLLATYHVALIDENGMMSARVTNEMMKTYGISEEQLKADAMTYMQQKHPVRIASLGAMVGMEDLEPEDPVVMFVSNESGTLGAASILYPGVKEQIAQQFGADFFILPSSTHEVLVVADDGNFSRENLEDMVRSANQTVVSGEEKLSDHVYHYDSKNRVLEKAETFEARTAAVEKSKASVLGKLKEKQEQAGRQSPSIPKTQAREAMVM